MVKRMTKKLVLTISLMVLLLSGCSKKVVPLQIKDVCAQPKGTVVEIQGYISLPKEIETIQLMRGQRIESVGLNLFLMTKADATGEAVMTTFWVSDKSEPNKIKPLPKGYTWNDLLVYTNDGKPVGAGTVITVTGETVPQDKVGCRVNVKKIELP